MCLSTHLNTCRNTFVTCLCTCPGTGVCAYLDTSHCTSLRARSSASAAVGRHVCRHVRRRVCRHVCRHVRRQVCGHVCRHVCRHVRRHVCRRVCRDVSRHAYMHASNVRHGTVGKPSSGRFQRVPPCLYRRPGKFKRIPKKSFLHTAESSVQRINSSGDRVYLCRNQTFIGHDFIGRNYIYMYIYGRRINSSEDRVYLCRGHNLIGRSHVGHNCIGHNYVGHNYIGRNYIGHNYIGRIGSSRETACTCA